VFDFIFNKTCDKIKNHAENNVYHSDAPELNQLVTCDPSMVCPTSMIYPHVWSMHIYGLHHLFGISHIYGVPHVS